VMIIIKVRRNPCLPLISYIDVIDAQLTLVVGIKARWV
jgi:hypothetical protein